MPDYLPFSLDIEDNKIGSLKTRCELRVAFVTYITILRLVVVEYAIFNETE